MFIQQLPDQSAIDHAVSFVGREAAHLAGTDNPLDDSFRRWAAISALNYVQHRASSVLKSAAPTTDARHASVPSAEHTLRFEEGICGTQIEAFIAIVGLLGVPVRDVQVFYTDDAWPTTQGHVVAEVQWDSTWHMFDVSWGFIPIDTSGQAVSFADARTQDVRRGIQNSVNPWWLNAVEEIDPLAYLDVDQISEVISGSGTVALEVLESVASGVLRFDLTGVPTLGVMRGYDGSLGNVRYEMTLPEPGHFNAVFEAADGGVILDGRRCSITAAESSVTLEDGQFEFDTDDPTVTLIVSSESIRAASLTVSKH